MVSVRVLLEPPGSLNLCLGCAPSLPSAAHRCHRHLCHLKLGDPLQCKDPCATVSSMPIDGLATQLRKGVIEYCVLAMLMEMPRYGGEVIQMLRARGELVVSEGTIYPLLSRMRSEGLVETEWRDTPGGAPRRYYRLSRSGQKAVAQFRDEWLRFRDSVDSIFRNGARQ